MFWMSLCVCIFHTLVLLFVFISLEFFFLSLYFWNKYYTPQVLNLMMEPFFCQNHVYSMTSQLASLFRCCYLGQNVNVKMSLICRVFFSLLDSILFLFSNHQTHTHSHYQLGVPVPNLNHRYHHHHRHHQLWPHYIPPKIIYMRECVICGSIIINNIAIFSIDKNSRKNDTHTHSTEHNRIIYIKWFTGRL